MNEMNQAYKYKKNADPSAIQLHIINVNDLLKMMVLEI